MSELQDALDLHDSIVRHVPDDKEWADHVKPIVDAARRVANLDIEAVADALDGGITTGPFKWRMHEAQRLVNLALGTTTENDDELEEAGMLTENQHQMKNNDADLGITTEDNDDD